MRRGNCGAVIGVCALGLGLGILIAAFRYMARWGKKD